jgi:hypothetical protein
VYTGCLLYYKPRPVSVEDLKIMRRIDDFHLDYPFAGSRMLRDLLGREGVSVGRRHVATLPCLGDGHHVYPDGARLRLSRGGCRLGEPARSVSSGVDHDGGGFLRRGVKKSSKAFGSPHGQIKVEFRTAKSLRSTSRLPCAKSIADRGPPDQSLTRRHDRIMSSGGRSRQN